MVNEDIQVNCMRDRLKKLRIIIPLLVMCFIMGTGINSVSASQGVTIYINGEKQSFSNQALIESGSTLVPLRGIFEALGAEVIWNQKDQSIDASKGNTKIWLKIGSNNAKVNGNNVTLTVPAKIINGNTLVPLRFISESLGENVKWDQATRTVYIGSIGVSNNVDTNAVGTLKGTVTYQYNKFIGTKPDVGAQIYIIPTNFDYKAYKEDDFKLYIFAGITEGINNLYYAEAKGYGTYELTDIPVGEYLVIIVSENNTRNPDDPIYLEDTLKPLIGAKNYETFKKFRLDFDKHKWEVVEIKKDKTKDFSHDFGYTYF